MKPVDFRNETFESIQGRLDSARAQVYHDLVRFGPCTTRVLAARGGMDLLTVRPRVTELVALEMAELVGGERDGKEGVYQAVPMFECRARVERLIRAANAGEQGLLAV